MMKLDRCVRCRGTSFKSTKMLLTRSVDGREFAAHVPARQCKTCGEEYFVAADGVRFELAVARRLAELGASSAAAFRFMRRTVGLQAGELAQLLGVVRET